MILITDSGSSKCTWCFAKNRTDFIRITTTGINPSTQNEQDILQIIEKELQPAMQAEDAFFSDVLVEQIFFYGAGCTDSKKEMMTDLLHEVFSCMHIEVFSDMLGAARSLFGYENGIACILGTGANSCFYNGERIAAQTPALGYILGDEGSGAYLGKKFIQALFKGKLPEGIVTAFQQTYHYSMADVIEHTYRMPRANRFLASLTPFLHQYREVAQIHDLICHAFDDFIFYNLKAYQQQTQQVSFIGSIAYYFQEELNICLKQNGFQLNKIIQDPMDGLLDYHLKA